MGGTGVFERVFKGKPIPRLIAVLLFMSLGGPLVTFAKRNIPLPPPMLIFMWSATLLSLTVLALHLTYRRTLRIERHAGGATLALLRNAFLPLGTSVLKLPPPSEVVLLPPERSEPFVQFSVAIRGPGYAVQIPTLNEHAATRIVAADVANFLGVGARDCSNVAGAETNCGDPFPPTAVPPTWPAPPAECRIAVSTGEETVRFEFPATNLAGQAWALLLVTAAIAPGIWLISWQLFDEKIQAQPGLTVLKIAAWVTLAAPLWLIGSAVYSAVRARKQGREAYAVWPGGIRRLTATSPKPMSAAAGDALAAPLNAVSIRPAQSLGSALFGISAPATSGVISIGGEPPIGLGDSLTPSEREWLARALLAANAGLRPSVDGALGPVKD